MEKIKSTFIIDQYRSGVASYSQFTKEVGLWDSEKFVFAKHLQKSDKLLDLGCGTGRTTFPLYRMGYRDIIAIDLTPEMIDRAIELNTYFGAHVEFMVGDATDLSFADAAFDAVVFSFNGLMSIPGNEARTCALREIHRVLKDHGIFVFTTHDRDKEPQYFEFWKEEKERWTNGYQDPVLHEFGDLITQSKNEERVIYIHIPNKKEIADWLVQNNFDLIDTFYRSDRFSEPEEVLVKSGECRFWVARKSTTNTDK